MYSFEVIIPLYVPILLLIARLFNILGFVYQFCVIDLFVVLMISASCLMCCISYLGELFLSNSFYLDFGQQYFSFSSFLSFLKQSSTSIWWSRGFKGFRCKSNTSKASNFFITTVVSVHNSV